VKNIQVIDGANNCTFPVFEVTDEEFAQIFPESGQDIEFIEDFIARAGDEAVGAIMRPVWERPILKSKIQGLHGTLFYEFERKRKSFPSSKREADWGGAMNEAQRRLRKS
jgi:hypothetical protein